MENESVDKYVITDRFQHPFKANNIWHTQKL